VLSQQEIFAPILLLWVLPQSKRCPAQPMQLPCNFSFPLPDRITKCIVTGRKALAVKSQRLDLEMQPLRRLMQVRHCHTYVYLHIHIPPYTSIFLCQKKNICNFLISNSVNESPEEGTIREELAEKPLFHISASEIHYCWKYFGSEDKPWSGDPSGCIRCLG